MKGPKMATRMNSKVIVAPIAEVGLENNLRANSNKRRHQDGAAPRLRSVDLCPVVTVIEQLSEPEKDLSVPGTVSFENL